MAPKSKSSPLQKLLKNHPEKAIALWVTIIAFIIVLGIVASQRHSNNIFTYSKSAVIGATAGNPPVPTTLVGCNQNNQTSRFTALTCPYTIVATGGIATNFTITKDTILQSGPNPIHKYDISCAITCNCLAQPNQPTASCSNSSSGTLVSSITTGCTTSSTFTANQPVSVSITLTGTYDNSFKSAKAQQACVTQAQQCSNSQTGNKICSGSNAAANVKPPTATLICTYCQK